MHLYHPIEIASGLNQRAAIDIRKIVQSFEPLTQKPGHRQRIFTSRIESHSHKPAGFPEHLNKDTRSRTLYGADYHWRNSNQLEIGIGPREGKHKTVELKPNLLQPRLRPAANA